MKCDQVSEEVLKVFKEAYRGVNNMLHIISIFIHQCSLHTKLYERRLRAGIHSLVCGESALTRLGYDMLPKQARV